MEDLVRSYWWLVFPLSWGAFGVFQNWLAYRARRDALNMLRFYAEAGHEPPAGLLDRLNVRPLH